LQEASERLLERAAVDFSFEAQYEAALVLLNLERASESVPYLKAALALRPHALDVKRVLNSIQARTLVLVVDDSPTIRLALSQFLERNHCSVVFAENGMEAISKLQSAMPQLILLDINMPGMDGYQTCKVVRANPETKAVPIVMLSGKDGFFDKVKGRLAGSSDYLTKPFKPSELRDVLQKFVPDYAAPTQHVAFQTQKENRAQ
jgi:twitching motility two-component system response regulator PilG